MKILWNNSVISGGGDQLNKITYGDCSLKKSEVEEHNLKTGNFVNVYIAPEKTIGSFKIVF